MDYDVAIIGAGWAGINAAFKARELGLKPALIERSRAGGTCLHRGCIPTKALIQSAKTYSLLHKSKTFGIEHNGASLDFKAACQRKDKVVSQLYSGLQQALKGIDLIEDEATLISPQEVRLSGKKITSRFILIASGSRPIAPQALGLAGSNILTSDALLELESLPHSLLVIGGGVIGCEFAALYASLGSAVTVVEIAPHLLPGNDVDIARKLEASFKKRGITILTGTDARTVEPARFETVLFAVGRAPDTSGIGLEALGVKLEKGAPVTDDILQTSVTGIYAAGDCTGRAMLAHAAAYQGRLAIENMFLTKPPRLCDEPIPSCIYTSPEIASIGLSEEAARKNNIPVQIFKADLIASGMARIIDETEGFIKIVACAQSGEVLGASFIGPHATELIGIICVAIKSRLKTKELAEVIFPHPTISESIADALKN